MAVISSFSPAGPGGGGGRELVAVGGWGGGALWGHTRRPVHKEKHAAYHTSYIHTMYISHTKYVIFNVSLQNVAEIKIQASYTEQSSSQQPC